MRNLFWVDRVLEGIFLSWRKKIKEKVVIGPSLENLLMATLEQ